MTHTTQMTVTVRIEHRHSPKCPTEEWVRYRRDKVRCPRYPQCKARGILVFREEPDSKIVKPQPGDIVRVAGEVI